MYHTLSVGVAILRGVGVRSRHSSFEFQQHARTGNGCDDGGIEGGCVLLQLAEGWLAA